MLNSVLNEKILSSLKNVELRIDILESNRLNNFETITFQRFTNVR